MVPVCGLNMAGTGESLEWEEGFTGNGDAPVDISEMASPRILLMGAHRSGKSSMAGVVFNKMPPHEVRHIENCAAARDD